MQKFKERREEILSIFSKATADLEKLNSEIEQQIAQNKAQIEFLLAENADMDALKISNRTTVKKFSNLFK